MNNFEVQNTGMKVYGPWAPTRQKNSGMLCKQGDNVVVNSMLRQQGDTRLIIYQSCHAIVKQDDSQYMINLAPVLSENMTFMDTTNCSYGFPASVPKN